MAEDNIRRNYYVYALIDPRNGQPFYIGKGTNVSGKSRAPKHYTKSSLRDDNHKNRIIKKCRKLGFEDKYIIYQNGLTETQALLLEEKYIKLFGRMCDGGCLTNAATAGNSTGVKNKKFKNKEQWRKNISESLKGNVISESTRLKLSRANKGKKLTEEHKAKLRKPKNIPRTPEHTEKVAATHRGKKLKPEHKLAVVKSLKDGPHKGKWYKLVSPSGEIFIIRNKKEFSEKYNLKHASLNSVISGRQSHHKGWECERYFPTKEEIEQYEPL